MQTGSLKSRIFCLCSCGCTHGLVTPARFNLNTQSSTFLIFIVSILVWVKSGICRFQCPLQSCATTNKPACSRTQLLTVSDICDIFTLTIHIAYAYFLTNAPCVLENATARCHHYRRLCQVFQSEQHKKCKKKSDVTRDRYVGKELRFDFF